MNTSSASRSTFRRLVIAAVVSSACLLSLMGASAQAATGPFWTTGQNGASFTARGTCTWLNYWHQLRLATSAPDVYARNNTLGGGNDWQWVRYRTYLVRKSTGTTLRSNAWSEWKVAWDTTRAPFASGQTFEDVEAGTVLEVRVEWWNQTQMIGAAAHRISSYNYFDGMVGPLGPIDSCAHIYDA